MHEMKALGPLLGCCGHLARERMDARLAEYDVTPAQIRVLLYLCCHGKQVPQCEIAEHLRVKPSTANGILDRMAEKGLIERSVSETDARRRLITLTEKGNSRQESFRHVFLEMEEVMKRGLSEEEAEMLFGLLQRVISNLEEDRTT